jgi:CheY-like chemotaxis protein
VSTILLVDDDLELLELYTDVLEIMGHHVVQAHDGVEALELAHRQRPNLIVTDWMMPRMDGVELCRNILGDAELHDIPIIMHSTRRAPWVPGIRNILAKVCSLEEFEEAVSEVLEGSPEPAAPESAPESTPDSLRTSADAW